MKPGENINQDQVLCSGLILQHLGCRLALRVAGARAASACRIFKLQERCLLSCPKCCRLGQGHFPAGQARIQIDFFSNKAGSGILFCFLRFAVH